MTCEVKTAILYLSWTARWQMKRGPIDLVPCFQGFVLYQFERIGITNFKSHDVSLKHLSDSLLAVHNNHDILLKTTTMCLPDEGGSNWYAPMLSGMCSTSIQTFRHHQFQESWPIVEDNRSVPPFGLPSIGSYDLLLKMTTMCLSYGVGPIICLTLLWISTIFYRRWYRLWIITLYSTRLVIPPNI